MHEVLAHHSQGPNQEGKPEIRGPKAPYAEPDAERGAHEDAGHVGKRRTPDGGLLQNLSPFLPLVAAFIPILATATTATTDTRVATCYTA